MKIIHISFHIQEVEDITELTAAERQLIEASQQMVENAYAPYSEFQVGAALLLENGQIIKGSNQENAAYPSGLCAERVAIFSASANYPGVEMKAIAVSAKTVHHQSDQPVSPCGACRQVLLEYEFKQKQPLKMFLVGSSGKIYLVEKVSDLLPLSFTAHELGRL